MTRNQVWSLPSSEGHSTWVWIEDIDGRKLSVVAVDEDGDPVILNPLQVLSLMHAMREWLDEHGFPTEVP